jgi:catechol 2,3-dioxygenase-like lactoylglutathione lyase family enzyme
MVNPETPPWPLPMEPVVNSIDHLVLNVADVEVSAAWYQRVLSMLRENFTPAGSSSPVTSLKFGRQKMNLRPASASVDAWFTARNIAPGSADLCFLTTNGPSEVLAHLRALDIPIEKGPIEQTGAQGTLLSVYCRDPDGNLIEIASYEA